jgi:hypothetical protein
MQCDTMVQVWPQARWLSLFLAYSHERNCTRHYHALHCIGAWSPIWGFLAFFITLHYVSL